MSEKKTYEKLKHKSQTGGSYVARLNNDKGLEPRIYIKNSSREKKDTKPKRKMVQVITQKEIQTANKQKKFHLTSTVS